MIHEAGDGLGPRWVYINGHRYDNVKFADTDQGYVIFYKSIGIGYHQAEIRMGGRVHVVEVGKMTIVDRIIIFFHWLLGNS